MKVVERLAYLGPPGTFSESAAIKYKALAERVPYPSILAVGEAVRSSRTAEGILPIENSLEGSVNDTLDLLIQEPSLFICQELTIPIEHCLLGLPSTNVSDFQVIYSHPQALGQCKHFLERRFPNAQIVATLSTVAAVEQMKHSDLPAAAIAPKRASDLYDVNVLELGIQDHPNNVTRFVVLALNDHQPTGDDKTSLCFSFDEDRPGLLYRVMAEFAERNINLGKVESRPTKETLGRYIFLVDIEGHREDSIIQGVLSEITHLVSMLRLFGSYPRYRNG